MSITYSKCVSYAFDFDPLIEQPHTHHTHTYTYTHIFQANQVKCAVRVCVCYASWTWHDWACFCNLSAFLSYFLFLSLSTPISLCLIFLLIIWYKLLCKSANNIQLEYSESLVNVYTFYTHFDGNNLYVFFSLTHSSRWCHIGVSFDAFTEHTSKYNIQIVAGTIVLSVLYSYKLIGSTNCSMEIYKFNFLTSNGSTTQFI